MPGETHAEFSRTLAEAEASLYRLERSSEANIRAVSVAFEKLAAQSEMILKRAAAIISRVEKANMSSVLPKVQALCHAVRVFLETRVQAAATILETLQEEELLLRHLTTITQSQTAVAAHLKALSVLTNIEVAKLGNVGHDFELLARELSAFSRSVFEQTADLARHAENCQHTIADARRELAASLPQLRQEMLGMEADLGNALQAINADLEQLARLPGQFKEGAEETARQIGGVVAAIQSHDITRQQIEHVIEALQRVGSSQVESTTVESVQVDSTTAGSMLAGDAANAIALDPALAYAGLTIQSSQLKCIRQTMANWTTQIERCMAGIQRLSASELAGIGPAVLTQEAELSSQLEHIALLQRRSQAYSANIQQTLGGLSNLLNLVHEQMERSESIRHLLQLLTFNSLIEADHLGQRGLVVSAIAGLIKEVSVEWNAIAEQSSLALGQILKLVNEANRVMEVFSEAKSETMRLSHAETVAGLVHVHDAAEFVAREAAEMQAITGEMQAYLSAVRTPGEDLEKSFQDLDGALGGIDMLAAQLVADDARVAEDCDVGAVERMFAASYTIEIEREVMRAALAGAPLPVLEQHFAGNEVELF